MNLPIEAMVQLPMCKIDSKYGLHFIEFSVHMIPIMSRLSDKYSFVFQDTGNHWRKLHMLVQRGIPHPLPMQNPSLYLLRNKCFLQI